MSLLPFLLRGDPAIEIANVSYGLLVRIHRMNLFADSAEHGERRDSGSNEDLGPNRHPDRVRKIHGGLGGIAQAVVARIADDANHLKPTVALGNSERKRRLAFQLGHAELAANGIAVRKILASQGLINQSELGAVHRLAFIPESSLQQRDVKYGEVLGADEVDAGSLLFRHWLAGNLEALFPAAAGRGGIGRKPGGDDFRHSSDLLQELTKVRSPSLPGCVGVVMHWDSHGHRVVRVIAKVHTHHAHEALHRNASPRKQQKRQGDLSRDQDAVSPAAMKSGGHFACSRLHHLGYIRTRRLKSRRDTEDDAGQKRKTYAKIQNRQIDADGGFMRE